jgi:hypothetical protein
MPVPFWGNRMIQNNLKAVKSDAYQSGVQFRGSSKKTQIKSEKSEGIKKLDFFKINDNSRFRMTTTMTTTTTMMMLTKIMTFLTVVNLFVFSSAIEDKHEVSFTFGYHKANVNMLPAPSTLLCSIIFLH